MSNRRWLIVGAVIAVLVLVPVAWYLISPLFIDSTVDEAFPFELPAQAEMESMSAEEMQELESAFMAALPDGEQVAELTADEQTEVTDRVMVAAAAVMADHEMDEIAPASEWAVVGSGDFRGADDFHQGSGTATVYQQGDARVLRFSDFEVTNGPDLHVILTRNPSPADQSDVGADYIDLGSLKGNVGNQNYELPDDIDLSAYQGVVIYCVPFHVVFATASLAP